MAAKKRKNPSVGIFDPNYSQDPQFGNVSSLKPGLKRIHLMFEGDLGNDFWYRWQLTFPECDVPRIDHRNIDKVDEIIVPVIKEFQFVLTQSSKANDPASKGIMIGGLFEHAMLSRTFPLFDNYGMPSEKDIRLYRGETIFALNSPIAYTIVNRGKSTEFSNMSERGYVLLQNYVFVHVHTDLSTSSETECFSAFVDYELCPMKYKDALIWKADFEKFISPNLKYRVWNDLTSTTSISRGGCEYKGSVDPSGNPEPVISSTLYRVAQRDVEKAGLSDEEFAWTEAVKKYIGKDESESESSAT